MSDFYRVTTTELLPPALRAAAPEVLWLSSAPSKAEVGDAVVVGRKLGSEVDEVLVSRSGEGLRLHFDLAGTAEGILRERYHAGLVPTIEMKLPFNYSILPSWVKGVGRLVRGGGMAPSAEVAFPPAAPSFVVDWLLALGEEARVARPACVPAGDWLAGNRAAMVVTYDVDTDWLLTHPDWIDRFCDIEDRHGLVGAYYCVPRWSTSRSAARGIERLKSRGREIGCHGYNHDAKWPLLEGKAFDERLSEVSSFAKRWDARGFRSEWLWRTPRFLEAIGTTFAYDSSVPVMLDAYTSPSRNGCGCAQPYRTWGNLLELPITLPMDEWRHATGTSVTDHFARIAELALAIAERGGLIVWSLHPQPHQAATDEVLRAYDEALGKLDSVSSVLRARPRDLAERIG